MKKLLLFILFGIILAGCTPTGEPVQNDTKTDTEKLQDYVREQLEQEEETEDAPPEPIVIRDGEPDEVEEETNEEEEEQSSDEIDIKVTFFELSGHSSYDIDDRDDDEKVTVEVDVETRGLEDGDNFIVKATVYRRGDKVDSCSFIYVVGEGARNECELDNFERYGTYDLEVYADDKEKYLDEEIDLANNVYRDEFELEA